MRCFICIDKLAAWKICGKQPIKESIIHKFSDSKGETIAETLAAVVIASISVSLLFGAIMYSGNIAKATEDKDEKFYLNANLARTQSQVYDSGTLGYSSSISISNASETVSVDLPVNFYGGDGILSYELSESFESVTPTSEDVDNAGSNKTNETSKSGPSSTPKKGSKQ